MLLKEKTSVISVRLALSMLAGSVFMAGYAHAQEAPAANAKVGAEKKAAELVVNKDAPMQKVYVTGSNVRRITLESASPVQVITREELTRGGATSLNEVLRTISSNVGGNDENRSSSFTAGAAGMNLRGIGSQSTLMLINGRRLAPYAQPEFQTTFVDLNSVPIGAVERIEILKDGASAIYGSEALAGVINIILRNSFEGIEAGGSVGQSGRNDGETVRGTISGGFGDLVKDHFNAYATLDVRSRKPMFISKRDDYLSTKDTRAWGYKDLRTLHTFPGNLYWTDPKTGAFTSRSLDPNCPADRLVPADTRLNKGAEGTVCVFDDFKDGTYNSSGKTDRVGLTSRLTWQPTASTTVFSELMFNRNKVTLTGSLHWVEANNGGALPALPLNHPQYPDDLKTPDGKGTLVGGNKTVRVRAQLRDFPGIGKVNTTDFGRYLVGAKGEIANWDWESALLLSNSKVTSVMTSGLLATPFLNAYNKGTFMFGKAASNAELYKTLVANSTSEYKSGVQQIDGKMSGELMNLPAGPVGLAVGAEARREYLETSPDPLAVAGELYHMAKASPAFKNSRRVQSIYGEATIPLFKSLEAQVAARFDHYSDYGNSTTPKVGVKWTLSPQLLVRGTYAEGFRAPTLVENSTDVKDAFQTIKDPFRCNKNFTEDCSTSVPYQSGSNPKLAPETAKSYTLGIAWEPTSWFLATLDLWQINRINEINSYDLSKVLLNPDHYANDPAVSVVRDPLTASDQARGATAGAISKIKMLLTNVASTKIQGVDLKLQGKYNMGEYGLLQPTLNLSHTQSYKTAPSPGESMIEYAGTLGTPSVQATLGLSWKKAAYTLSADTIFIGKMSSVGDRTVKCKEETEGYANMCTGVSSFTVVNLGGSYTGIKDLKLSFAVQNAFDRKPPFRPYDGNNYYAPLHSAMGRYFQLTADYKFK